MRFVSTISWISPSVKINMMKYVLRSQPSEAKSTNISITEEKNVGPFMYMPRTFFLYVSIMPSILRISGSAKFPFSGKQWLVFYSPMKRGIPPKPKQGKFLN